MFNISFQSHSCTQSDVPLQEKKQDNFLAKIANLYRRCVLWIAEFFNNLLQKISFFNWQEDKPVLQVTQPKTSFSQSWKDFKKNPLQFSRNHPTLFISILALYSLKGIAVLFVGYWAVS